jgi:hypothetical protein
MPHRRWCPPYQLVRPRGYHHDYRLRPAEDFDYFLALLFILRRFDRSAWGRLGDENLRSNRYGTKDETTISVGGKEFTFNMKVDDDVLRKPFAIGGRATGNHRSQMGGDQAPSHVIKSNWKEATRNSKPFIFEGALRTQNSLNRTRCRPTMG